MTKLLRSYWCVICDKRHYEDEALFVIHANWKDINGIKLMPKPNKTAQSDLVKDYNFPDVQKKLKMGLMNTMYGSRTSEKLSKYKKKRDFSKTPEPKGE